MNWQSQRYEPPNRPSAEAGPSHSRSGSSAGNSFARPSSHQRSYSDAFSDTQSHGARGSIDRDDDGEEGDRYEDNIGATPRNARFDHASSDDHHHQHDSQHDPTLAWRTPDNAEDEHFRARLEAVAISPSTAESEYAGVIPDLSEIGHGHPPGHLHSDGAGTYEQDPGTAKLSPEARAEADDLGDVGDAVHFVLLAEFDIDQGSTLAYQYPYPTGTDEHRLAELMLPDGAHLRAEDWTIFYLGQDHQLAIDPMLAHELSTDSSPSTNKRASMYHPSERPKRGAVGGGLLHVLSCVRCKEDKTVKRGALVKSLAICSPVPWIHVFKPILLLALEEYFQNPSPEVLEHLYDCCNSPQVLGIPRLTRAEKIIMRLSDRKDMFAGRYEEAVIRAREAVEMAALGADDADAMGMGSGRDGLASANMARRGSSASSQLVRANAERKGMRDTHYFDTEVQFRQIRMPMKVPVSVFSEEVGDYSLIELISTFSNNHPPFPAPYHPYLHTNGAATHPIILLINALLAHKRVLVLGTQFPAHSVARAVLGVCALGTGCGQVLRGITETALPYCNLSCYEMLEGMSGFIAGVTNPRFVDLPCWDVVCDVETGRITVNKNLGGGLGPTGGSEQAGTSEASLGSQVRNEVQEKGRGEAGRGKDGSRADCLDNQFMEEITQAIQSHYGEMHIRRRMTDYIMRFVRVAAYYEYRYRGSTKVGYSCTPFHDEYLGQGTTFADEGSRQKELVANQPRIEAWRRTKGYKLYVKDWAKEVTTRKLPFDVAHQVARLRNGQGMSHAEAEAIFEALATTTQTHEQVLELLSQCAPHFGGLAPIANGLLHPGVIVRESALELMMRLEQHPIGQQAIASLNYFQRKAYMHLLEKRRAEDAIMVMEAEAIHALHGFTAENNGSARQDAYDAEHERVVYELGTA